MCTDSPGRVGDSGQGIIEYLLSGWTVEIMRTVLGIVNIMMWGKGRV